MAFRKEFRHLLGRKLLRHCESAPNGDPAPDQRLRVAHLQREGAPLPPFASCYDKLAAAAPLTESGTKGGAVARRVNLHELTVFPNGKHDDQADSTAQFPGLLQEALSGPEILRVVADEVRALAKPGEGSRAPSGSPGGAPWWVSANPVRPEISTIMMDPNRRGMDRYARRRGRIDVGRVFALCV
jgi:hypothetical protein